MDAPESPAPVAPRQRYGLSFWLLLICAMALGASLLVNLVMLAVVAMATSGEYDEQGQMPTEELLAGSGDRMILQIDIEGVISTIGEDGLFGPLPSLVQRVQEQLDTAAEDGRVAGLILSIDSPGGGVTASDQLYHAVQDWQDETGLPVLIHMGGVCASGGYYIACAGEEIYASPTTVTGSIGVIMTLFDASKLLGDTLGIEATPIMSGPYKDMASPLRGMSDEEKTILQGIVDRMYERFLAVVDGNRAVSDDFKDLSEDQRLERLRGLADGRIYHADQAEEVGLVDGIAYSEQVYQRMRERIGLSDAPVVRYRQPQGLAALLQAQTPMPQTGIELAMPEVRFEYRWQVGGGR